jgi:hypothetical protein
MGVGILLLIPVLLMGNKSKVGLLAQLKSNHGI